MSNDIVPAGALAPAGIEGAPIPGEPERPPTVPLGFTYERVFVTPALPATPTAPLWVQSGRYAARADRLLLGTLWPRHGSEGLRVSPASGAPGRWYTQVEPGTAAIRLDDSDEGSVLVQLREPVTVSHLAAQAGINRIDLVVIRALAPELDGGGETATVVEVVQGEFSFGGVPVPPDSPPNSVALARVLAFAAQWQLDGFRDEDIEDMRPGELHVGGGPGPEGPEGPAGPQGEQGEPGPPGVDGTSTLIVGSFGQQRTPADLPQSGLIPANWDGFGRPLVEYQMQPGQSLIYEVSGDLWSYVSFTNLEPWVNVGQVRGPAGPTGPQGEPGPPGAQGPPGSAGDLPFSLGRGYLRTVRGPATAADYTGFMDVAGFSIPNNPGWRRYWINFNWIGTCITGSAAATNIYLGTFPQGTGAEGVTGRPSWAFSGPLEAGRVLTLHANFMITSLDGSGSISWRYNGDAVCRVQPNEWKLTVTDIGNGTPGS